MDERAASILHDHYKDTFTQLCAYQRQRDRLFLIVIALLGLLVLQLRYSAVLTETISEVSVLGINLQLDKVPVPALLSTTWTFFSVLLLRYYQAIVHVDKQYDHVHKIEKQLSDAVEGADLIGRESTGYFIKKGWWFRHWTWVFYTAVFPSLVGLTTIWCLCVEWRATDLPVEHRIYDTAFGVFVLVTLVCYLAAVWLKR